MVLVRLLLGPFLICILLRCLLPEMRIGFRDRGSLGLSGARVEASGHPLDVWLVMVVVETCYEWFPPRVGSLLDLTSPQTAGSSMLRTVAVRLMSSALGVSVLVLVGEVEVLRVGSRLCVVGLALVRLAGSLDVLVCLLIASVVCPSLSPGPLGFLLSLARLTFPVWV